jgi:hypothetical protein
MKNNQAKTNQYKSTVSRIVLSLLVVGFSLISIINACKFLIVLFGLSMGILISSTIEITRLSCLFIFVKKGKGIKILAIATYIVVATVSSWCNINAFTYEVIKRQVATRSHHQPQIQKIKQAFCHQVAKRATPVATAIKKAEDALSLHPNSATWKRRLATALSHRDSLMAEQEAFLKQDPKNPAQWIKSNAAKLDIELPPEPPKTEDLTAISQTLHTLWNLNKTQAQQLMGIIITALVELSILLLSFIAHTISQPHPPATPATISHQTATGGQKTTTPQPATPNPNNHRTTTGGSKTATPPQKIATLPATLATPSATAYQKTATPATGGHQSATPSIDQNTLEKFIATHKALWQETGQLPKANTLSRKFRKIRKTLSGLPSRELDNLFG